MKKLLLIALVVIMLASAVLSASAIDARYLGEWGQQHIYLGDLGGPVADAPVQDGKIGTGEYIYSYKMTYDGTDDYVFPNPDAHAQEADNEYVAGEEPIFYASYDEKYMYFAMTRIDNDLVYKYEEGGLRAGDQYTLWIGSSGKASLIENISRMKFQFRVTKQGLHLDLTYLIFGPSSQNPIDNQSLNADLYAPKREFSYDQTTGQFTVEFAVNIERYEKFWECDTEKDPILFRVDSDDYGPSAPGAGDRVLKTAIIYALDYRAIDPDAELLDLFMTEMPEAVTWRGWGMNALHLGVEPPPHEHSYSTEWTQTESSHFHACECGDKKDVAGHAWDDGVVTKEPTVDEKGEMTSTCTVCGYKITEDIKKLDPSKTQAPSAQATTPSATTAPDAAEEGGCGSAISLAALAVIPALAVAFVAKKKED